MTNSEVVDYLSTGGLVAILKRNQDAATLEPVWLYRNNLGQMTYTFIESIRERGGITIPAIALFGDRLFSPRKHIEEVNAFLGSIGLTQNEIAHVISCVGTSP